MTIEINGYTINLGYRMKFKSNRIIPSKETFPIFVNMIENFPFGSVIFELDDGLKILANNKLILRILGFKSQEDFVR